MDVQRNYPTITDHVLPLRIFGFCDLHPSGAVIWGNSREDTGQIPYSKVLNVFPGVYPLPDLQSHAHGAQSMKAAHGGGAETESREGTCRRLELRL